MCNRLCRGNDTNIWIVALSVRLSPIQEIDLPKLPQACRKLARNLHTVRLKLNYLPACSSRSRFGFKVDDVPFGANFSLATRGHLDWVLVSKVPCSPAPLLSNFREFVRTACYLSSWHAGPVLEDTVLHIRLAHCELTKSHGVCMARRRSLKILMIRYFGRADMHLRLLTTTLTCRPRQRNGSNNSHSISTSPIPPESRS